MKILVTGAAGFIGFHLTSRLLREGHEVVGVDNLNSYYSPTLKLARLAELGIVTTLGKIGEMVESQNHTSFRFVEADISDREFMPALFRSESFDTVVNLAAQAGVRYSIENPFAYVESNVVGFLNILECCRYNQIKHLVYASSSSVYGSNEKIPFAESDNVDCPESLYAATKRSDELMASCYAKLYNLRSTGLRFFTVYGPWGRPDMAPMLFADAISSGRPLKLFNGGDMERDFTFIDDIVEGVMRVILSAEHKTTNNRPHEIYNIGNSAPVKLNDFIAEIENQLGCKAERELLPMQAGDVKRTYADTSLLEQRFGYRPTTSLHYGVKAFIDWYKNYKRTDI